MGGAWHLVLGKLGRAWVGAWDGAWCGAWHGVWVGGGGDVIVTIFPFLQVSSPFDPLDWGHIQIWLH